MSVSADIHAVYEHALRMSGCHAHDLQCIEPESLERIHAAARGNCVEIGTRHGISTLALLWGATHVWSIDVDSTCAGLFPCHWPWTFVCKDGAEAAQGFKKDVALLLIDGSHSYDSVKAELRVWEKHLEENADIFLHDAYDGNDIRKAISEFCKPRGITPDYHGILGHFIYKPVV